MNDLNEIFASWEHPGKERSGRLCAVVSGRFWVHLTLGYVASPLMSLFTYLLTQIVWFYLELVSGLYMDENVSIIIFNKQTYVQYGPIHWGVEMGVNI